jgi:hypothetical protein
MTTPSLSKTRFNCVSIATALIMAAVLLDVVLGFSLPGLIGIALGFLILAAVRPASADWFFNGPWQRMSRAISGVLLTVVGSIVLVVVIVPAGLLRRLFPSRRAQAGAHWAEPRSKWSDKVS